MSRRRDKHLYLAFRVDPSRGGTPGALLGALREAAGSVDLPVHWVLPPGGVAREDAVWIEALDQLRERLAGGRDRVVLTGHRGSLHPLLALPDALRDVSWAARNPWKTGVTDVLGVQAVALCPPCPDWSRPPLVEAYAKAGAGVLILDTPAGDGPSRCFHRVEPESGLQVIRAVRAGWRRNTSIRARLRGAEGPWVVLLDGPSLGAQTTRRLLAQLRPGGPWTLSALPDLPPDPAPAGRAQLAELGTTCLPCTPLARNRWLRLSTGRRARGIQATVERLEAFGTHPPASEPPEAGSIRPAPRNPSSAMPGAITLGGEGFEAWFENGMLQGLRLRDGSPTPLAPVVSFLRFRRGYTEAVVESSTSFEDGALQGLRTVAALGDGGLVADTFFPPGAHAMAIEILARYPDTRDAVELVPLGLRLALSGPTKLTSRAPDAEITLSLAGAGRDTPHGVAFGSSFTVEGPDGALTLWFPARAGQDRRPLPWCLRRRGRDTWLELNPMGSYEAADLPAFDGHRERMTLLISPTARPPAVRPIALKGLQHDGVETSPGTTI